MKHSRIITKKKLASLLAIVLASGLLSAPASASELPAEASAVLAAVEASAALVAEQAAPPAAAEQTADIPEPVEIYVNGDNSVFTLEGELSALFRLYVDVPGRVHILTSGVDVSLVLFNETVGEVCGVYSSVNGVMDAPLDAYPGTYLLGFSGWGEAAVLAADEEAASAIFSEAGVLPSAVPAASSGEASGEQAGLKKAPAPISCRASIHETVYISSVLRDAGASVSLVKWVSGDMEGRLVRADVNGDWLLTPYVYFNDLELSVLASDGKGEDTLYTVIFSCPDPAQEPEITEETPVEEPETTDETPADEPETTDETLVDEPEITDETPADEPETTDETPADEPETTEETPADEPETTDETPVDEPEITEETPVDESETTEETPAAFDPSVPITRRIEHRQTISVLSIMAEAGAPVNVITHLSGETEGKVAYVNQNHDWLLTPFNYFDALELSVNASDYLVPDSEAVYTVILSNPDPAQEAVTEEETPTDEPEITEETPADEPETSDDAETSVPSELVVTITMERSEGNVIRLSPVDLSPDADQVYTFQWQVSMDNEIWTSVDGATDRDYTFTLNETIANSYWRLVITEKDFEE